MRNHIHTKSVHNVQTQNNDLIKIIQGRDANIVFLNNKIDSLIKEIFLLKQQKEKASNMEKFLREQNTELASHNLQLKSECRELRYNIELSIKRECNFKSYINKLHKWNRLLLIGFILATLSLGYIFYMT